MTPLLGALAGAVATVPMSAVMLAAGRRMGEQPPDAIADRFTPDALPEPAVDALAVAAHLAFGAGLGVAYALLPPVGPPVARATALALVVYAASYEGWVPALGILPPASRDRRPRVQTMVAAHVVFGAVLGLLDRRWDPRSS